MEEKNVPEEAGNDSLAGVPGIGTVRRKLLTATGITTCAALAQASPEQLVSLTGMPRTVAERVLASLPAPESPAPAPPNPAPEATLGDDAPETTRLERAVLKTQTALSDASRHVPGGSKLGDSLLRFALLADELPRRVSPDAPRGVQKRIAGRLQNIAERLETLATATRPLSEKRAKRLQQRLKRTRDTIKRTLKSNADTVSAKVAEPAMPPVV